MDGFSAGEGRSKIVCADRLDDVPGLRFNIKAYTS